MIGAFAGPLFKNAKPYALIGDITTRAESFEMHPRRSFCQGIQEHAALFRGGIESRKGLRFSCAVSYF
jgi:hypothetical protein